MYKKIFPNVGGKFLIWALSKKMINLEKTAENGQTSESREEKKIFKIFPVMLPTNSFVDQKPTKSPRFFFN